MPDMKIEEKTKDIKTTAYYIILIASTVFGGTFVIGGSISMLYDQKLYQIALDHFPATIGLPCAALASLCIVIFLEHTSGSIEAECLGFKFKGASGPIVFWILCFLSITLAIKILW
jgi:hypothetical protein